MERTSASTARSRVTGWTRTRVEGRRPAIHARRLRDSATFSLVERDRDGARELGVGGELDLLTAPRLVVRVREAVRAGERDLRLDLSATTFMDAAGVAALLNVSGVVERAGGRLAIVAPAGQPARLLELVRVRADPHSGRLRWGGR